MHRVVRKILSESGKRAKRYEMRELPLAVGEKGDEPI